MTPTDQAREVIEDAIGPAVVAGFAGDVVSALIVVLGELGTAFYTDSTTPEPFEEFRNEIMKLVGASLDTSFSLFHRTLN